MSCRCSLESPLTSIHNLCVLAIIRKIMHTAVHPNFTYKKWSFPGCASGKKQQLRQTAEERSQILMNQNSKIMKCSVFAETSVRRCFNNCCDFRLLSINYDSFIAKDCYIFFFLFVFLFVFLSIKPSLTGVDAGGVFFTM